MLVTFSKSSGRHFDWNKRNFAQCTPTFLNYSQKKIFKAFYYIHRQRCLSIAFQGIEIHCTLEFKEYKSSALRSRSFRRIFLIQKIKWNISRTFHNFQHMNCLRSLSIQITSISRSLLCSRTLNWTKNNEGSTQVPFLREAVFLYFMCYYLQCLKFETSINKAALFTLHQDSGMFKNYWLLLVPTSVPSTPVRVAE